MKEREIIQKISKVIKKHFPNLTTEKTIDIAVEILNAIDLE